MLFIWSFEQIIWKIPFCISNEMRCEELSFVNRWTWWSERFFSNRNYSLTLCKLSHLIEDHKIKEQLTCYRLVAQDDKVLKIQRQRSQSNTFPIMLHSRNKKMKMMKSLRHYILQHWLISYLWTQSTHGFNVLLRLNTGCNCGPFPWRAWLLPYAGGRRVRASVSWSHHCCLKITHCFNSITKALLPALLHV